MNQFFSQEGYPRNDEQAFDGDRVEGEASEHVVEPATTEKFDKDYGKEFNLEAIISYILSRQDIQQRYFGGVLQNRQEIETALIDDPELVGKILADTD